MGVSTKQTYPVSTGDFIRSQTHKVLNTTGNTTTTIHTVSPSTNSSMVIKVNFMARETGTNKTTVFSGEKRWHLARGTGAPTLLSAAAGDGFQNENFPGNPTFQATVSGNNILIRATGIAVTNINWQASFLITENINNG